MSDLPDHPNHRASLLRLGNIAEAKKAKPFLLTDALWRRLPVVIGIGTPAFLLILLLLSPLISPIYKVSGVILIKQERQQSLNGNDRDTISGDVGVFQRTLAVRVLDAKILKDALKSLSDDDRPKFLKGLDDSDLALALLTAHLSSQEVERSYLVNVELTGKSSKGLAPTLNAILKALLEELEREQTDQYTRQLDYLRAEKAKISGMIAEERQRMVSLADRYKDTSFLRPTYTADLTKLELLQNKYYDAASEVLAKEALYNIAKTNKEELSRISVIPFAEEKAIDNLGISEIESYNYQQSQELRATVDGLTLDNQDRKNVESRIQAMKGFLEDFKNRYKDNTVKTLSEKRDIQLDTDLIRTQHEYEAAKASAEILHAQYKEAKDEAARTSEEVFEANEMTIHLAQLRDRFNLISTRLDEEELLAKSPLPVVLDQEATTPGRPTSSNAKKILILAFLASFGLVGGCSMAFDFFDQRIRSREELGGAVGGLGANPIPFIPRHEGDPEFCKKETLRSTNRAAAPLRDLALRLILEHERGDAKIISFVGLHRRAGNTSILLNVARAISAHGFDVLLAEMPTNHPGLAAAADLPPMKTMNSPWGNKAQDPSSAVELIPWVRGNSVDQARRTLDSFLAHATQVYDFVLLDLVALPSSDVSREVSVKSDVVVLTAAQDIARYPDVSSTVAWIVAGGVPAITTVLNFAKPNAFRLRGHQLFSLLKKSISQLHDRFIDWAGQSESRLFAKLTQSPRYKKLVEHLHRQAPPAPSKPQENQDS